MKGLRALIAVLLLILSASTVVQAHESQPGTVDIRQADRDRYEIVWRAPVYFGRPHPARLELPAHWKIIVEPTIRTLSDSQVFRQVVTVGTGGVEGSVLKFPGLENTITDVFVRLNRLDGTVMTAVVRPTKPYAMLHGERSWYITAGEFVALGFHHILGGADHLLFVLGLLLIVRGRMTLIKTITAFTGAHSITLALAALGYAGVPRPPLEVCIALSIFFLGPEIVRNWRGETSLTLRYPWLIALLFGLLHGFGFATGLTIAGMPKAEVPLALFFFNVGVEFCQLLFVFSALAVVQALKVLDVRWPRWAEVLPGYAVGSLGAYWTIQRAAVLMGSLR